MKFEWQRLNAEYAKQFGIERDEPTLNNVTGGNRREDQNHQHLRERPGESAALLHRRSGLREEGGFHPRAVPVADRCARPTSRTALELQLALNDNPAAQAYQQAMFEQNKPAAMFYVDDVQQEHDRMKPLGAEFTMPPTKVTGSTIAMLNDTCGNLIQIVALDRWKS